MTKDRARKQSIRARMSVSGEPYCVAARKLTDDAEPGDAVVSLLPAPDSDEGEESLLEPLADMRGAASARFSGEDIVRGMPCRVIAAETGSREFTVWVDDVHVRQMSSKSATPSLWGRVTAEVTLELWDFGVATEALDWSRFQGPDLHRRILQRAGRARA